MFTEFSSSRRLMRWLLAGTLLLTVSAPALADLMIYPTRIVLEGNERAAKIELMNNGSTAGTYRISLENKRMTETGTFEDVEKAQPGELFADPLLRYSPRQVTLAPGEGQTVRLLVRKPADLADGEYRSHLVFSKQPEARAPAKNAGAEKGIGIQLTALVGVSIPVIVRQGQTSMEVALSGLELQRKGGQPVLDFVMGRTGNRSVYGDLTVAFQPRAGGEPEVIARANGVAVYTPNPLRRARVALHPQNGTALRFGTLLLEYRSRAEDGGDLLASASLVLP